MNFKHILCIVLIGLSSASMAQKYKSTSNISITKDWQQITFTSDKTLQENIAQSSSFSIMAAILEDQLISNQLSSQEMVTVFVANDSSFLALDETNRKALLSDNQRVSQLVKFHTIPGRVDKNAIEKAISISGGIAYFMTLDGEKLAVSKNKEALTISDSKGNTAVINETDFYHKNGFFHMVEGIAFDTSISQ
ncbi:MAG: fasciclin domain-containing protein [Patiriisocius sp.]